MAGNYIRTEEHKKLMSKICKGKSKPNLKGKKRPLFSKEWCKNISKAKKDNPDCIKNLGIYASPERPYISLNVKGDKNPRWKGGISKSRSTIYDDISYKKWREMVFKRDNYICQICGYNKGHILRVHHIIPFVYCIDYQPELLYVLENGITLCHKCHIKIHKGKVIPKHEWIENIVNQAKQYGIPIFMKNNLKEIWGGKLRQEKLK